MRVLHFATIESPAGDGGGQNGQALLFADLADVALQILFERAQSIGVPLRIILLLIVVSELDNDVISGLQLIHYRLPAAFVAKALRAAAEIRSR